MVVQLRDVMPGYADYLKLKTGESTASKAFIRAALIYADQLDMIARLERENGDLKQLVRVQQQIIERARSSASALLDHVAQKDLLNE